MEGDIAGQNDLINRLIEIDDGLWRPDWHFLEAQKVVTNTRILSPRRVQFVTARIAPGQQAKRAG